MRTPSLPLIHTLRGLERRTLRGDVVAGLTTAVMLVPQGMAYALLAGLDPIVGLYASTIPVLLYAVFGTSPALAVGPVALDSMLVAAAVAPIAAKNPAHALSAASLLALMVGGIQLLMGLLRLGKVVRMVKRPVLSGFTTAAAVLIATSQLGSLIGVSLPRSPHVPVLIGSWVQALPQLSVPTVVVAVSSVVALLVLKARAPKLPRFLIVVVAAVVASWALDLATLGVPVVGEVPAGLPLPTLPRVSADFLWTLVPGAVSIAAIGTVEVVAIGSHFARERGDAHQASQELVAIGVANLGAGLFRGYPVSGGFSRSAVHAQAGSNTPLSGLFTAVAIGIVLLVLTPVFGPLPKAVLAAIILTAIVGLVDLAYARTLWRTDRARLAVWTVTLGGTLALGMLWGLALGIVVSSMVHYVFPKPGEVATPRE